MVQSQQTNDDLMIKRILDLISEQQSISAMDLARSLNLSVVVAQEELEVFQLFFAALCLTDVKFSELIFD